MKRAAIWILIILAIPVALFIFLRATAIPLGVFPASSPLEPPFIIVSEHPKSRWSVWRATLDHIVSPVPEFRDSRLIRFGFVMKDQANHEYLALGSRATDSFVAYACGPNNELLWKAYVDMSP
jgi:hypothetical protein